MIDAINTVNSAALASAMREASTKEVAPATIAETDPSGATFADFVNSVGATFAQSLKTAETTSMDGIMGKASAREVVEAVMSADQTLQTAMAFRDKIVSAYLEVIKMPI